MARSYPPVRLFYQWALSVVRSILSAIRYLLMITRLMLNNRRRGAKVNSMSRRKTPTPSADAAAQPIQAISPAAPAPGVGSAHAVMFQPRQLIAAETDEQAIEAWLLQCSSAATAANYRKDADRFLMWIKARGRDLRTLVVERPGCLQRFLSNLDKRRRPTPSSGSRLVAGRRPIFAGARFKGRSQRPVSAKPWWPSARCCAGWKRPAMWTAHRRR